MLWPRLRGSAALLASAIAACHTVGPAPMRLWVAHSGGEVLAISADTLSGLGFTVSHRDSTRGSLSAVREAANEGNDAYTRCGRAIESNEYFQSTVAVTVTARDSGGGASVGIEVTVPDASAPMFAGNGAIRWRCASSGRLEAVLVGALRAPSRPSHHPA